MACDLSSTQKLTTRGIKIEIIKITDLMKNETVLRFETDIDNMPTVCRQKLNIKFKTYRGCRKKQR